MSSTRWKKPWIAGAAAVAFIAFAVTYRDGLAAWFLGHSEHHHSTTGAGSGDVAYYTCSMDPSVKAHGPGKCPICGMDLTPVSRTELESGAVRLDPDGIKRAGVRVAAAEKKTLRRRIVALGAVVPPLPGERTPAGSVWVEAPVYGSDAAAVTEGQAVRAAFPDLPLTRFEGTIALTRPEPEMGGMRIRAALVDPGLALKPGMTAEVLIDIDLPHLVVVPAEAVLYAGERRVAFVEREPGLFQPRPVQIGVQVGSLLEVRSGIAAGERVAKSGTFLLAAESRIRSAKLWQEEPAAKPTISKERAEAAMERAAEAMKRAKEDATQAAPAAGSGAVETNVPSAGHEKGEAR